MKRFLIALVALACLGANVAVAQVPNPSPTSTMAGQVSLSVTNATSRVALPSTAAAARSITIYNKGTKDAFYATGTVAVVATTSSTQIAAGTYITFWAGSDTYVAAITGGSDTTTLVIYQGNGPLQFGMVGSSGGAPSGPAGGDLSGTYPNPTVAQATMGTGGLLTWNGDVGLSRDSVLGAGNVDLGNGTANNKTGKLNLAAVFAGTGLVGSSSTSLACMNVSAKNVAVLTSGTPADIGTIPIPSGITRYRVVGSSATLQPALTVYPNSFFSTQAAAAFTIFTSGGGGGTNMTGSATGPIDANTPTGAVASANATAIGGTLSIRQTANSASIGNDDFYVYICPMQ